MIRRLLVRWLWPEIVRKLHEPHREATARLVKEGLLRDRRYDCDHELWEYERP